MKLLFIQQTKYLFHDTALYGQTSYCMKSCILITIALCLFSCNDEPLRTAADGTVHLAGFVENPGASGEGTLGGYWKDGVFTALASSEISSQVGSLYVDGSSVLIGGVKYGDNTPSEALIWRDGTETVIEGVFGKPMVASRNNKLFGVWLESTGWVFHKNGTSQLMIDTAYDFGPMAMALRGDDMYISGYSAGAVLSPTGTAIQHAQYWKNDQLLFRESEVSNGLSIFTLDNDVYMAGILYPPGSLTSVACYWKNGQRFDLTDRSGVAMAKSVFVTDNHVYVAGMINNQAVYWKDGDAIILTTGSNSMANAIFVQEENVHVGGYENGYPAYWKNDVKQDIANQDKLGQIRFIVVGSN
jgi:hypothetical protein